MIDKTRPTPGLWWVQHGTNIMAERESGFGMSKAVVAQTGSYNTNGRDDIGDENEANARLIAAAGTAAHEVAQMGYDPVKSVQALPAAIQILLKGTPSDGCGLTSWEKDSFAFLDAIRTTTNTNQSEEN